MEIKKLIIIAFGLLSSYSCTAYEFKQANELTLFKNYVLSSCVASNYKNDSIYNDAIDSLNGNREYANMPLDAYYEINDLIDTWSKKKYTSKAGNVSEFFMCIDLQNSKDVLSIYKKYDPCNNKKNWDSSERFNMRCKN